MAPERDESEQLSTDEAARELAQFEPDPDGLGDVEAAAAGPTDDDPRWIVWDDAAGESDWAADELGLIPSGWRT